jgi:glycosyltransferase involved in cell wall biosynthesis
MLVQNHYDMDIRVRRKAEALVAAGYEVDVLALAGSASQPRCYTLNGVTVRSLSLGKKRGTLARYVFEYMAFLSWAFFKLAVLAGKRRYAVVDVNTLPDFLVFAAAAAKWRGAKVVLDMHEITPEFYMSKYRLPERAWAIRLMRWLEKVSFLYADHVLTINEPIQKLLEGRGLRAAKSTIIMNAVDEALFASSASKEAKPESGIAQPKFLMMYHGTLTPIYGLDIAIEAFGLVYSEMPGAEFWILGGGTEKQSLEEQTRKLGLDGKVKFIGNVLPQEVPQWLKRCDVGVLATRRDVFLDFSFSNKLSEYIIMDKAVICSRLKAIRHCFSEDAFAFFEPHDTTDLGRKMLGLYRDAARRSQLTGRARQEYAPIRWDVMKQRYVALMGILSEGRLPGLIRNNVCEGVSR